MDGAPRRADGPEPSRIVFRAVAQQAHGVALDRRGAHDAGEQLVGHEALGPADADRVDGRLGSARAQQPAGPQQVQCTVQPSVSVEALRHRWIGLSGSYDDPGSTRKTWTSPLRT